MIEYITLLILNIKLSLNILNSDTIPLKSDTKGLGIMIKIHLSKLLGEKRWTQADLSRKTGIRPNTISEIYNELVERISLDYLDSICEALECDISDLLEYIPNKNKRP